MGFADDALEAQYIHYKQHGVDRTFGAAAAICTLMLSAWLPLHCMDGACVEYRMAPLAGTVWEQWHVYVLLSISSEK